MDSRPIKRRALRMIGRCLRSGPGSRAARGYFDGRSNIVFLHGVWEAGTPRRGLFTGLDADAFRSRLVALGAFFEFVGLDQVLDPRPGRPRLHLTFDDGLDLTGGGATDIMDSLGISATVFVNTACVANRHLMWQHLFSAIRNLRGDGAFLGALNALQGRTGQAARAESAARQLEATRLWPMDRKDEYAAELWRACDMPPMEEFLGEQSPYMDWAALDDWSKRGHTIGFHTHSHPFCSRLADDQVEAEILEPARQLRDRLGLGSIAFAYPFGDRLPPDREARLAGSGVFSCLLGTGRFSRRGAAAHELDRVEVETGIDEEVFGRPLVGAVRSLRMGVH